MSVTGMDEITLHPIGVVHSPDTEARDAPGQSTAVEDMGGTIEVFRQYRDGLKDLEGFSHIFVLFYFDQASRSALLVRPEQDDVYRGVFATRAPTRPNPIGLSVVQLLRVEGTTLHVRNLDIVDSTPVLDIKPYIPDVDVWEVASIGWLEEKMKEMRDEDDAGRRV